MCMKEEIIKVLEAEIIWHNNDCAPESQNDYQKGFIKGIEQSVFLITQFFEIWEKGDK